MQRDSDFTLELTASLFEDIMANQVAPAKARLKGNICIVGDTPILVQLADRE